MKTELYYFTGTGNGLHIAKSIRKNLASLNQEALLIPINTLDLSQKIETSAERIGIIYPTYGMTAPAIVKAFAHQLSVSKESYVFLYAHSGGAGCAGSLYPISKILSENGVEISNTFETKFPSNSTLMAYKPGKVDQVLVKSEVSVQENMLPIINKEKRKFTKLNPIKKASLSLTEKVAGTVEHMMQFKVIAPDDSCNGCSTCVKVCPVGNIELENKKPTFSDNCEMCLSCVNQCPKKSLSFGKMKKEKLISYRHPQVTIKELMYR